MRYSTEIVAAFGAIKAADMTHEYEIIGGEQLAPEIFVNTFVTTDGIITHVWDGEKFTKIPWLN